MLLEDYLREPPRRLRREDRAPRRRAAAAGAEARPFELLIENYHPEARARPKLSPEQDTRIFERHQEVAKDREEPALRLEADWDDDVAHARRREAKAISLALHTALIVLAVVQPHITPQQLDMPEESLEAVALVAPPRDVLLRLTQPEPSPGREENEFRGLPEPPRPAVIVPEKKEPERKAITEPPPPVPTQPEPPKQEQPQPEEPPAQEKTEDPDPEPPPPTAAESPNPDTFRPGDRLARRRIDELPPPRAPSKTVEKPKLELEDPKASTLGRDGDLQLGSLALNARPDEIIEGAVQNMARSGGGRQMVGDGTADAGGAGYLPPSPGNIGSNIELLSDPKGIDFRPYLTQILAAVRRNWYAVIPESARLGLEKGRVAIQFAVVRDGTVSKLVIANTSGSQPLDRAAVAGISASHPFPPLPSQYSGDEVRLQFVFLYNIRTR